MGYLYFIIHRGRIIRIGKTTDIIRRIREYLIYLCFDDVRVIECSLDSISLYERRLITYFKPIGNSHFNPAKVYKQDLPFRKTKRKRIWEFESMHRYLVK